MQWVPLIVVRIAAHVKHVGMMDVGFHLIARTAIDISHMLATIGDRDSPLHPPHQPGDEFRNGERGVDPRVAKQERIQHKGRDFK